MDRKKDLIIASGYNIVPREVEEVLFTHPKVLEAAVVGVPDAKRGETVKAVVVLREGQTALELRHRLGGGGEEHGGAPRNGGVRLADHP